jgi:predicted glycosyltransferase
MVGFGHIRRNASIAQALTTSPLHPAVVMIAEAWQAGTLPMPRGVDCVTLPAMRKEGEGRYVSRFMDVPNGDLVALRSTVIRSAMEAFDPDVLIVDHLPLGAARELADTLDLLRRRGRARCVLGLRDVLQDRATVHRLWSDHVNLDAVRDHYDAIWVYADPAVYDLVHEYDIFNGLASRVRFTGYLDQRPRLGIASTRAGALMTTLPPGRLALCLVGGGFDGDALAEAFVQAKLPDDMIGIVVTGPYMPDETRERLTRRAGAGSRMQLIDFLAEPLPLVERADRVVAMGGYNTICEVLSLEKHALIVPRAGTTNDQWIRAQRLREMGLVETLAAEALSPGAIGDWLARDLGPPPATRGRVDLGGLDRIPALLAEVLAPPAPGMSPTTFPEARPWSAP